MMKDLEYYVPLAELGKEFLQILGITVKCWLACEHCTAIHKERCLFYMLETCESGERTKGIGTN
jgi:hypothetical protein